MHKSGFSEVIDCSNNANIDDDGNDKYVNDDFQLDNNVVVDDDNDDFYVQIVVDIDGNVILNFQVQRWLLDVIVHDLAQEGPDPASLPRHIQI